MLCDRLPPEGREVLDEPTTLPEGTVVDLVADDEGDDLADDERLALHEALSASWESAEAGRLRPASDLFADELAASFDIIGHAPNIGRLYQRSPGFVPVARGEAARTSNMNMNTNGEERT